DDLDRMRTVNRPGQPKRQTRAGIVTLGRIIGIPLFLSPFRIGKFFDVPRYFGIGYIRPTHLAPHSRHAWFSVRKAWSCCGHIYFAWAATLTALKSEPTGNQGNQ